MRIEQPNFASTSLGQRWTAIVKQVATAAQTARDAWAIFSAARAGTMGPVHQQVEAQALVNRVVAAGMAARNAGGDSSLGFWKPFDALHTVDDEKNKRLQDKESRYDQVIEGVGIQPYAFGQTQVSEITLPFISMGQRRATSTGWVDLKIDMDTRFVRDDPHVRGLDNVRRSSLYRAPFRISPRSTDTLSILVSSAVEESLEYLDNFRSAMGSLAAHGMSGFSCGELVWKQDVRLRVPAGNRTIVVNSEVVQKIAPVSNRNFAFDIVTDEPFLCMGPGEYVPVLDTTLQKFLFIQGDGPSSVFTRFRGWGWANSWLSYLGALPMEKLGILVETFGVATPFLQRNDGGIVTEEESRRALRVLEELGTGKPALIPGRMGELKHSPVPTNLAPLHAQMIGIVNAAQSKNIMSSTLQIEIGGVGSRAAAEVHENQETKIEIVDATVSAEALRGQLFTWIVEANAVAWATAFAPYVPGGCTPEDILARVPKCEFVITDETPSDRSKVFESVKGLGFAVDEKQVREETRVRAPCPQLQLAEPPAAPTEPVAPAVPPPAPTEQEPTDDSPKN